MRVTFLKTRDVDAWRRGIEPEARYEAGRTYSLPDAVARYWLGRGVAILASVESPAQPAPPRAAAPRKVAPQRRSKSRP